jgi:hypothetical protein
MSQVAVAVSVHRFRKTAKGTFDSTEVKGYQTIVDDAQSFELPMVVLEKDAKGNMVEFLACKVTPAAPIVVKQVADKPTIARKTKMVKPEEPETKVAVVNVSGKKKTARPKVDHGPSNAVIDKVVREEKNAFIDSLDLDFENWD